MKRETLMSVVTMFLLGAAIFIYAVNSESNITFMAIAEDGSCADIGCISQSLVSCTPAQLEWTSDSGGQQVTASMEVLGSVDGLCGFKWISDGRLLRECYFTMDSLSENLAEQFLKGKDNGLGQVISDSCK